MNTDAELSNENVPITFWVQQSGNEFHAVDSTQYPPGEFWECRNGRVLAMRGPYASLAEAKESAKRLWSQRMHASRKN